MCYLMSGLHHEDDADNIGLLRKPVRSPLCDRAYVDECGPDPVGPEFHVLRTKWVMMCTGLSSAHAAVKTILEIVSLD
jgi:hypothetical protein